MWYANLKVSQATDRALARARAAKLVADGKAKILPVVNSQVVKNAQYGLAACSFSPEIIGGTCGLVDGLLYGLQGNGTSAGLSFVGAIPVAGLGFDAAKAARLIGKAAVLSTKSVAEFLSSAKAANLTDAKLAGSADVVAGEVSAAKKYFDEVTKGWKDVPNNSGGLVTTRMSPDSKYSMNFRTKGTSDTQIINAGYTPQATVDVFNNSLTSTGHVIDSLRVGEVKFVTK